MKDPISTGDDQIIRYISILCAYRMLQFIPHGIEVCLQLLTLYTSDPMRVIFISIISPIKERESNLDSPNFWYLVAMVKY